MPASFLFKIAPTMDQGSYSTHAATAQEALDAYNRARAHDCQPPLSELPPHTVTADKLSWGMAKDFEELVEAWESLPSSSKGYAMRVDESIYYAMLGTVPPYPVPSDTLALLDYAESVLGIKAEGRFLVGEPHHHDRKGRPRCAYFFRADGDYYFGGYQAA